MYAYAELSAGLGQELSKCLLRPIWYSRDIVRVEPSIRFQIFALELLRSIPTLCMSAPTPLCKSNVTNLLLDGQRHPQTL
jgi:hypothetical protein